MRVDCQFSYRGKNDSHIFTIGWEIENSFLKKNRGMLDQRFKFWKSEKWEKRWSFQGDILCRLIKLNNISYLRSGCDNLLFF